MRRLAVLACFGLLSGCIDWNGALDEGCLASGSCSDAGSGGSGGATGGGSGGATGGGSGGATGGGSGGATGGGSGGATGGGSGGATGGGSGGATGGGSGGATGGGSGGATGGGSGGATGGGSGGATGGGSGGATGGGSGGATGGGSGGGSGGATGGGSGGATGGGTGGGTFDAGVDAGLPWNVLVADYGNHRVVSVTDVDGGANWFALPAKSQALASPNKLAFDSQGRLYVVDTGNVRLLRMDDLSGTNLAILGTYADLSTYDSTLTTPPVGLFKNPISVWVNQYDDTIHVVDSTWQSGLYLFAFKWNNGNIQSYRAYSTTSWVGNFNDVFGASGPGAENSLFYTQRSITAFAGQSPLAMFHMGSIPLANSPGNSASTPGAGQYQLWCDTDGVYYQPGNNVLAGAVDTSAGFRTIYGLVDNEDGQHWSVVGGAYPSTNVYCFVPFNDAINKAPSDAGVNYGRLAGITGDTFSYPSSVSVDDDPPAPSKGFIYVADTGHNRVVRALKTLDGSGWGAFSGIAADGGALSGPRDIKWGPDGGYYIADTGNDRLVRINNWNTGAGWTTFSSSADTGTGHFSHPTGASVGADGKVYVADTQNHRVVRMDDPSGTNWTEFGPTFGLKKLVKPTRIVSTGKGIWILEAGTTPPQLDFMTDMTGANWQYFVPPSGIGNLANPQGLAVDPNGHVFISDTGNNRIIEVDDFNGTDFTGVQVKAVGSSGSGGGNFNSPNDLAVDATNGYLYIADTGNNRVAQIVLPSSIAGLTVTSNFFTYGAGLNRPYGVAVGSDGKLYVADTYNHRILRMDGFGTGVVTLGSDGSGTRQFVRPTGIAVR